jgi:hypothetical protein
LKLPAQFSYTTHTLHRRIIGAYDLDMEEGRYPNGLLLAITNCTDPSKEGEFNAWYNHMHMPAVTAPGIFRHALRFVNTDSSSQAGQYVATYETNWEDASKAIPAHREASVQLLQHPSLVCVRSGASGSTNRLCRIISLEAFRRQGR